MPRISAATNAAQRENTKRAILDSFGQLLYQQGLTGLTMTHVAKNAGVGRTAVYNYFADMGELLVAYALDETERFMTDLRQDLEGVANPVDRLAVYIRAQIEDLTRRHLPPGPTMRTVLAPEDYQKLGEHVGELQGLLAAILRDAIVQGYLPDGDIPELATLVHGSLTAAADRGQNSDQDRAAQERHIRSTVRFIQQGLGARFDAAGHPVPVAPELPPLSAAS
ncbi:TetR/AcrR family transcriptional regulator [Kocuria sp. M1R5S2]|uniref:TetR/AcrR family transcriptional regulator n=1 Tax=Kocuria rhizosphaerae TaxID=3376285 RepID=UPI0037BDEB6D